MDGFGVAMVAFWSNEPNIGKSIYTFRYERTDSHVFILRTLFRRKCGKSELRALLEDVKWEKSLA